MSEFVRVYPKQNLIDQPVVAPASTVDDRFYITRARRGHQNNRFLPAPHVFVRNRAFPFITPNIKMNGNTNNLTNIGWNHLGRVEGLATVKIETETNITQSSSVEFNLSQFDDFAFEQISGLSGEVIEAGNTIALSSEDTIQKQILLVMQNAIDDREIQVYNPLCTLIFEFQQNGELLDLHCTGHLQSFVYPEGNTTSTFFTQTWFA